MKSFLLLFFILFSSLLKAFAFEGSDSSFEEPPLSPKFSTLELKGHSVEEAMDYYQRFFNGSLSSSEERDVSPFLLLTDILQNHLYKKEGINQLIPVSQRSLELIDVLVDQGYIQVIQDVKSITIGQKDFSGIIIKSFTLEEGKKDLLKNYLTSLYKKNKSFLEIGK